MSNALSGLLGAGMQYEFTFHVNTKGEHYFVFIFPPDSAFAGEEVVPTLKKLVEMVNGILESFTRLVAARTS
jgi:hypothetical protein